MNLLHGCKDWTNFVAIANKVRLAVNQQYLNDIRSHTLEEIPESFVDVMYNYLCCDLMLLMYVVLAVEHQYQMNSKLLFLLVMETAFITACQLC